MTDRLLACELLNKGTVNTYVVSVITPAVRTVEFSPARLSFVPAINRRRRPDDVVEKANTMRAIDRIDLVWRLLDREVAESEDPDTRVEAAERISNKLRIHLSKTIGLEGFRTLLIRALAVTTRQFPRLNTVTVGADGSLIGLHDIASTGQEETPDNRIRVESVEEAAAVIANLLVLLVTFIGEDLTLRIVSTVWPELAATDAIGENARP